MRVRTSCLTQRCNESTTATSPVLTSFQTPVLTSFQNNASSGGGETELHDCPSQPSKEVCYPAVLRMRLADSRLCCGVLKELYATTARRRCSQPRVSSRQTRRHQRNRRNRAMRTKPGQANRRSTPEKRYALVSLKLATAMVVPDVQRERFTSFPTMWAPG